MYNEFIYIFILFSVYALFSPPLVIALLASVFIWHAQSDNPSVIRVASVIGLSVLYSLFSSPSVLCYIFSNPTAVAHCINHGQI